VREGDFNGWFAVANRLLLLESNRRFADHRTITINYCSAFAFFPKEGFQFVFRVVLVMFAPTRMRK
jgi:hypothetical protein